MASESVCRGKEGGRDARGVGDDDDDDLVTLQHETREEAHLSRSEDEHRHDGRILVTINDEAELLEASREVAAVERQTAESVLAFFAAHEVRREVGERGDKVERRGAHNGDRKSVV